MVEKDSFLLRWLRTEIILKVLDSEWYQLLFLFTISWHVQIKGFGALIYTAEEPHLCQVDLIFVTSKMCFALVHNSWYSIAEPHYFKTSMY